MAAGECGAAQFAASFRELCDHVISTHFFTANRQLAQEASDLLDLGNALLAELGEAAGRGQRAGAAAAPPAPAAPQLPAETFFLPAGQVPQCLAIAVGEDVLARAAVRPRRALQPKAVAWADSGDDSRPSAKGGKRRKLESTAQGGGGGGCCAGRSFWPEASCACGAESASAGASAA